MPSDQVSLIETLNEWDERLFCGREPEMALFDSRLGRTNVQTSLLAINGIGGIGKSTLVRAFARHAASIGVRVAITSADSVPSPMPILAELVDQLGRDGDTKKLFADFRGKVKRLHTIENRLRNKAQEDENAAGKVVVEAAKGGIGSAAGIVVGSALVGPAGAVAGGIVGGALNPLVEGVSMALGRSFKFKGVSQDDEEFLAGLDRNLTLSFLAAVNALAARNTVALFFDAVEYLGETTQWLRDDLLAGLSQKGVIVVLA